jgi:hypothetical protein
MMNWVILFIMFVWTCFWCLCEIWSVSPVLRYSRLLFGKALRYKIGFQIANFKM